jgi:predicted O-linked N-acetylglucosamine transferase (SPINDLY family)
VTTFSDAHLSRRIEQDGIDILIDLSGHTSMQRMNVFAQRAAPVQATYLGYPASTGVPNMDWLIADTIVAPKDHDSLYSEKVIRLPNTVFCYAPEVDYPYPDYTTQHEKRQLTFGSFNNVPKLTPHTIKLWAAILNEIPDSRLVLKAPSFKDGSAIQVFTERFVAEGVDASRLEFRGPVGLTEMMAEYADIDIALDPVPYNGGTTTLQAMWMGVPVIVKTGNHFVSRMGASFMSAAGLSEWVAENDADYLRIAIQMGKDRNALLSLKQGLRKRLLNSPAWNVDHFTADFENALLTMWREYAKK